MEKLEIAIAGFRVNPKNIYTNGIATPPPPIPPTLAKSMKHANTKVPIHSLVFRGQKSL